ncbi:Gfo/Idh/MocA family protein [Ulvibacterium marinum]|uniref:Gfo/Idh/MocA family oxidoreductase n=1 Tax=Ulvibacterium marinum TaxID=2419782 RepID=A0A3B0C8Y7_9FLAO|nr:Gfo/Idh/MocA family oxidoreductase [Ulvibacterium marinum]RKN80814.1 gfo/Idh/MocA family oxidoreductase [Ulvibacterium marinum]
MRDKIQWGILGTATIAKEQVIPAMQKSNHCTVMGIASRDGEKAERIAKEFHIPKYYEGYQALLNDPEIEAVYIPLPNHLHVEWAKKALIAGKHVLIEKPIALSSKEGNELLAMAMQYPGLKVAEAFMYKFHPQWIKVKQMVDAEEIGELKTIQSSFSFFEDDPDSIVNIKPFGGGSLMDIGCYSISISRFLFGSEPKRVLANIEYHPEFKVDILASGILEFEGGSSSFFCATQLVENQQVQIFGTEGSIRFELPFNPPNDRPSKIWFTRKEVTTELEFEPCNQYTLQADAFSLAILENEETGIPLEDAVYNLSVIEKMHESAASGCRVSL